MLRNFWFLLMILGGLNLIQAWGMELLNDEAYYWMFAQYLDWAYFDHPPMIALWIAITDGLGGALGLRLSTLIFWLGAVGLLYRIVKK